MMMDKRINLYSGLCLGFLCITGAANGTNYYVDNANSSASDSNPGTAASPWKTIAKANQTLSAGDTVYIKQGTYTDYISPARSGTASARITYQNFNNDNVLITQAAHAATLYSKSYITIQGLNFSNLDQFLDFETSSHNIVAYCTFNQMRNGSMWSGSWLGLSSQYNWIHHCTFSNYGYFTTGSDWGTDFHIGDDYSTTDHSDYNILENCTFFHGGHDVLAISSSHNVIRNNYLHNENWYTGYGERDIITGGYANCSTRNLFEGNRIACTGNPAVLGAGSAGLNLCTYSNIVRFNCFYGCTESGIMMGTTGSYMTSPQYNMIYNNVFYTNGFNTGSPNESKDGLGLANWGNVSPITGNAIKNNIFYKNPTSINTYMVTLGNQIITGNWMQSGDPLFVDVSTPINPANAALPNFQLKTNSPCVDAGVFLTTIASPSGSGTVFKVGDATFFMDGWGIVQGDQVQLQGSQQRVRITNINYDTKTLTVDTGIAWTQGQGIAMPYAGSAPDMGAFESGMMSGTIKPSPPSNLRVVSVNN